MEYTELTEDERILLVGLTRMVAGADHAFSEQEKEEMVQLANKLGEEPFKAAATAAGERLATREAMEAAAGAVSRPEARELIFTSLQDMAVADEVAPEEAELINWLADLWDL